MLALAVLVVMNVAYALSAYPVGVLADNDGRHRLLAIGICLLGGADLVLGLVPGIAGVAIGAALWGLHMGFMQGLFATLVADNAPPELRGTAFELFNLVTGGALLAASVLAGMLWDRLGAQATYLADVTFAGFALLGLMAIRGHISGGGTAETPA